MEKSSGENPNQSNFASETEQNPWQSLSRTADQDRGAMIIENEDKNYKRERTQDYKESEQGQSELKLEAAFDKMAEDIDAMVAEGKISREARDELLEKHMNIVIDLIDEVRANYETAKKEELIDRLTKDFQKIEQEEAAQAESASSGENETPTTATTEEQTSSSAQSSAQQTGQAPKKVKYGNGTQGSALAPDSDPDPVATPMPIPETKSTQGEPAPIKNRAANANEGSQGNTTKNGTEPVPSSGPEGEELLQQKAEELRREKAEELQRQHALDLFYAETWKLIGKDGGLEDEKIALEAARKYENELNAQITGTEQELARYGWEGGLGWTASESRPSSVEDSLEQIRNDIKEGKIGGPWGSAILLDTAPLSDTIRARNSAWWRELSQPQRDEVIKFLKNTEKISSLPYGRVVRDWLTENGWLAESQAPAAAA